MRPENKRKLLIWSASGLVALALLMTYLGSMVASQTLRSPLAKLDLRLGVWRAMGADSRMDDRTKDILKPQDYLLRDYVDPYGRLTTLFVAYFGLQEEGRMIHSPRHCLPGAGWQITGRSMVKVPGPKGSSWRVNHLTITNNLENLSVLYWYQGRGRVESDEYTERLMLLWDGLTLKRSDGALVRMTMVVSPTDTKALENQLAMAQALIPALNTLLPPSGRAGD